MKRFIEGQSRTQGTLLPEIIDEYVEESNPVRIVDVFAKPIGPIGSGLSLYHLQDKHSGGLPIIISANDRFWLSG